MKISRHPGKWIFGVMTLATLVILGATANAAGNGYRTIYRFQGGSDGRLPLAVPVADRNGDLYGTTGNGGAYNLGTVYKLTAPRTRAGKWTKTVLHSFASNEGGYPVSVMLGKDGNLYGADHSQNIFELMPPTSPDSPWKYALLYTLNPNGDGSWPEGRLVFDADGNLYGAAHQGGDLGCGVNGGCGTAFELKRPTRKGGKWHFKVLHAFTGKPDGAVPYAGATFDGSGNLYGTTSGGGSYDWGAVYRLNPPKKKGQGWTETVLYSFDTTNNNIIRPDGPVAFDSSGNLYGTTAFGGDPNCQGGYGCGVVFELVPSTQKDRAWTYATLYEFHGGNDGVDPQGYMVFDSRGNLYSTTYLGGKAQGGTTFRLSPSVLGSGSWMEAVLHWFPDNKKDGYEPEEGITWGKWGDLYGVTLGGGTGCGQDGGCGTVFELQP